MATAVRQLDECTCGTRSLLGHRVREFLVWLLLGWAEPLPHFFKKRHESMLRSYERSVGMLIQSVRQFAPDDAEIAKLVAEFDARPANDGQGTKIYARFETLLDIDARLIAAMPDDILVARRWLLLNRFRRIAPERAYAEYEASLPPSTDKLRATDPDAIRPDLVNLNNYMQQLYVLNIQREQVLAGIKWWLLTRVMLIMLVMGGLLLSILIQQPTWPYWPTLPPLFIGLVLIYLAGTVGAVTSISRKFQDIAKQNILSSDPLNEIVALNSGRESVAVSIMAGGIFALLIYLLVATGSASTLGLHSSLFPSIHQQREWVAIADGKKKTDRLIIRGWDDMPEGIEAVSLGMGFAYGGDLFRMLLLSFLAGFAERLVPDSIDRLIKREKAARES